MKFYNDSIEDTIKELNTTVNGLTSEEASKRLEANGKNKLVEAKKDSLFKKFINSISDPMIIMLIVAAAVQAIVTVLQAHGSFKLSDFADVIVILAVVIINTVMSLVQESKAEEAMEALKQMTAQTSRVIRDGSVTTVKSEDLVVGDVLVFDAGDAVPADCRIIESFSMKAEEAALTGESVPVTKIIDVLMLKDKDDVPLGDRKNMLYNGSTIVYGRGKAVVTACGMDTEMGKIADALSQADNEQTPLQKKMTELSHFLTKLVLIICAVVFAVGLIENLFFTGEKFSWLSLGNIALDTFVAAIALAVAAIPEGLPAVVTIILSIGVTSMSKRNALIRKLTAVETLGCTQIICSDKTGTLTQNKMTVVETYGDDVKRIAESFCLCTDAVLEKGDTLSKGDPTQTSVVDYALKEGLPKYELEAKHPRIGEIPFDSMRKLMTTVHVYDDKFVQHTTGAPDVCIGKCTHILKNGEIIPMTEELRDEVKAANKAMADKALRVLASGIKIYDTKPESFEPEDLEKDLIFLGLEGMIDPVRPEVKPAIDECRTAGIRPIMITGDHIDTATAIAKQLGILNETSYAITGADLSKMSDEEFKKELKNISVYARVQPEHKTRIVNAWKDAGYVTAMTGDGVNDAPSIKAADIGIGMGITGTDVTKGVADMVLADDNFATIVNAVEEGRKIYDNVCKVLQFQLSTNMSEVIIMFIASLLNFTLLSPVHLLWINMVTDSLPGLALGMEKAEGDVMKRKPRLATDGIFAHGAGFDMVWQGIYMAIIELAAFFIGFYLEKHTLHGIFGSEPCANAMAMAFLTLNFSEMFCAINMRSRRHSIFSKEKLKNINWWLVGAFAVTTLFTLAAIYMPGLSNVFGITPGTFDAKELAISIGLALTMFPVFELGKYFRREKKNKETN